MFCFIAWHLFATFFARVLTLSRVLALFVGPLLVTLCSVSRTVVLLIRNVVSRCRMLWLLRLLQPNLFCSIVSSLSVCCAAEPFFSRSCRHVCCCAACLIVCSSLYRVGRQVGGHSPGPGRAQGQEKQAGHAHRKGRAGLQHNQGPPPGPLLRGLDPRCHRGTRH